MAYEQFTNTKKCELCGDEFTTKDVRTARLCFNCRSIEKDIRAVAGDTTYSQITADQKARIMERVGERKTVAQGPFFNIKRGM